MGRPKKNLTPKEWESVKYMVMIHCTGEEIAGVLQMDYDTLNRNCKDKYGYPISEYIKRNQSSGKMSLRRLQWKSAENGNITMQIFLGKQWLGQREQQDIQLLHDDDTIKEMDEYFREKSSTGTTVD